MITAAAFTEIFSTVALNTSVYDKLKTGNDLLEWIQSEHFHKKVVNGKTLTTPHNESLYEHLMECAIQCGLYAAKKNYPNQWKFFLTGFLHDIGKPGCTVPRGNHLCMKGHGIVGSAIVENITSEELLDTFNLTKSDISDIATAINYHMCGYHARFPREAGSLNMDSFSLLTPEVKDLICALRIGDTLAIQSSIHDEAEKEMVLSTQEDFKNIVTNTVTHSDFMIRHGTTKGVLIMMQGNSGQGKSTMARKLKEHLQDFGAKVVIFSRDNYMVNISRKYMKKPSIDPSEITGAIYREALDYYVANKKQWANEINSKLRKDIKYNLLMGNIVIVDTLSTMYMHFCDIIPEIAQESLRIAVWLHRSNEFTEDETMNRIGCTVEEQIKINKERPQDFTNPIGGNLFWENLVSVTERSEINPKEYKKPHFQMVCGWSGLMDSQLMHLMELVLGNYKAQSVIARPPCIEETVDMTLVQFISHLYKRGGIKLVKEMFEHTHFTIKIEEFNDVQLKYIVVVKYIDGINQLWKPRWAREARGRGYAINCSSEVYEIKNSLIRGAELLTKAHLEEGVVDTQDVQDNGKIDTLDTHQQTIMKTFNQKENIPLEDAYVTQKVDGSLLVVSFYPINTPEHDLMRTYTKIRGIYHVITDEGMYIPATSGNVYMSEPMKDYFVTAVAAFCDLPISETSNDKIWDSIKNTFAQKIKTLTSDKVVSLIFEMVCKNRTTHENKIHTELAIAYPFSDLFFLGTCNGVDYIPHYKQDVDISQPAWCKVSNTSDTIQIMKDIEKTIKEQMTVSELNSKWFNGTKTDIIHPEGLIYLDHHVCDSPTSPTYSKLKLPIYYLCHNFSKYSLTELLKFPSSTDVHFPILGKLRWYSENISETIIEHANKLNELVEEELSLQSVSYQNAPVKAKKRFEIYAQNGIDSDKEILCKMITNSIDKVRKQQIIDMTRSSLKISNNTKDEEVIKISKDILMQLLPWKQRDEIKIADALMNRIYKAVMLN